MISTLSKQEVELLALNFYRAFDTHADATICLQYLDHDSQDFEMLFLKDRIRSKDEFIKWYNKTIRTSFDESHKLKEIVNFKEEENGTVKLDVIIAWESSTWTPPDANSIRYKADIEQSWIVTRSSSSSKPLFQKYILGNVTYSSPSKA